VSRKWDVTLLGTFTFSFDRVQMLTRVKRWSPGLHLQLWAISGIALPRPPVGSIWAQADLFVSGTIERDASRMNVDAPTVLLTMLGNIVAALLWLFSTSFSSFLLSRLVGGLSEGNVQLAIAIISDVSTTETRARSLALVGIAFSIAFTTGPPLGAYFASRPLPTGDNKIAGVDLNVFAFPATITLGLLVFETLYIALALPETRGANAVVKRDASKTPVKSEKRGSLASRKRNLRKLGLLHFFFLFFFSGELR
jgi:MFS family permease